MNRDERKGAQDFRKGIPFSSRNNIDWQRGWLNASDDSECD
jgi:hypothetical protein